VTIPLLLAQGHEIDAPAPSQLDLFDPVAVASAVEGTAAIVHLATRIPPRERAGDREVWRENDRLRVDASRLLVDAALTAETDVYVQPSVTFLYPAEGLVDELTPLGEVPERLRSALTAEQEAGRFASAGRRGVVLRLACSTAPARATSCRTHGTAPPCTLPMRETHSLRRSPFRAPSTTSAVTATGSRTSASNG
jgi:hypothetical protein